MPGNVPARPAAGHPREPRAIAPGITRGRDSPPSHRRLAPGAIPARPHPSRSVMSTPLARLRVVGLLEGLSFLLLLGVAMPLKYVWGMPEAVRIVGSLHGLLFVLYALAVVHVWIVRRWPIDRAIMAMIAAVLPFGPFVFERSLRREEAAAAREPVRVRAA